MNHDAYAQRIQFLQRYRPDMGTSCIRKEPLFLKENRTFVVDIIVPAYNVQAYIDRCIQSVLKQKTSYPFRVIVIDDGSQDQTWKRLERYQGIENLLLIHQENQGLSGARNTGLLYTEAEYVMFVDSDDCLPFYAVEKLVSQCVKNDSDIVAGSYCNFRTFRWARRTYRQTEGDLFSELELTGHCWGKVYRRALFERIKFPERYCFEDSVMHQIVFPMAKKRLGISDIVYHRRVNSSSITQTSAGHPKSLDSLWVTLQLMKDREQLGLDLTQAYYEYLLNQIVLTHTRIKQLGKEVQEAAFLVMAQNIEEQFRDVYIRTEFRTPIEKAMQDLDFEQFDTCIKTSL